jgi:hypothetical protein
MGYALNLVLACELEPRTDKACYIPSDVMAALYASVNNGITHSPVLVLVVNLGSETPFLALL